ncbi:MAG: hypothetical protein GF398_20605 [Chitinivibrionales bacterium]|nr:hypothetical protein [Chitinivibrionales bacterium]
MPVTGIARFLCWRRRISTPCRAEACSFRRAILRKTSPRSALRWRICRSAPGLPSIRSRLKSPRSARNVTGDAPYANKSAIVSCPVAVSLRACSREEQLPVKVLVLTISDRAARGVYADESGPEIRRILLEAYPDAQICNFIVPDEGVAIRDAFAKHADCDAILTTGGTGIGPRDITPDITAEYCKRLLPGIAEILRSESYTQTPQAMLSRGVAGVCGATIIINFPGSVKAVRLCTRLIVPVLAHAPDMLAGEGH